jgi:membrane-associated phospholipid phosphatase
MSQTIRNKLCRLSTFNLLHPKIMVNQISMRAKVFFLIIIIFIILTNIWAFILGISMPALWHYDAAALLSGFTSVILRRPSFKSTLALKFSNLLAIFSIWLFLLPNSTLFTYVTATWGNPFIDNYLQALDLWLGYDWVRFSQWALGHELIGDAYASPAWQLLVITSYLTFFRKDRNPELLVICFISLLSTSILAGIFPAVGAPVKLGYSYPPTNLLFALRQNPHQSFEMLGIITFPSYHTVEALLFIYILRGTVFFLPSLLWNTIVLVSISPCGGHYLADILGGGIVTVLSISVYNLLKPSENMNTNKWTWPKNAGKLGRVLRGNY